MSAGGQFKRGDKLWVHGPGGSARPAICVGDGENAVFLGGPGLVYVVFEDTREPGEVEIDRVTPRA
jgi:hypothetical protein